MLLLNSSCSYFTTISTLQPLLLLLPSSLYDYNNTIKSKIIALELLSLQCLYLK